MSEILLDTHALLWWASSDRSHGERAGSFEQAHGDPFDRMLAAQSLLEGIPVATSDRLIRLFGVETVW